METQQLENTEEDNTFDFSGIPITYKTNDKIDELKNLIKKTDKTTEEIGRLGVLKMILNSNRLCNTDIIFEHTFHSVKVNERYLLDNTTLEHVIVSFHCTVVGIYNDCDSRYKNTNVCNFEVVIEPPKYANNFIEYCNIRKNHFMEWSKDQINDAEKYIYDSIKNNTFKNPYVGLPRFFLNDELEDDNLFKNRSFPLKHITNKTQYTYNSDLLTIYKHITEENQYNEKGDLLNIKKWFPHFYCSGLTWDVNHHLLLCYYFVGALKKISKEYIRRQLINRHNLEFHNHSKKDNHYLNVFDFYFSK